MGTLAPLIKYRVPGGWFLHTGHTSLTVTSERGQTADFTTSVSRLLTTSQPPLLANQTESHLFCCFPQLPEKATPYQLCLVCPLLGVSGV